MLHTPFPWLCIPTCCLYMCLKQSCACTRRRVQGLTSHARTSPSGSTRRAAPAHAHTRLRALSDKRETPPRSHLPGFALFQHGGFRLTHASVTLAPFRREPRVKEWEGKPPANSMVRHGAWRGAAASSFRSRCMLGRGESAFSPPPARRQSSEPAPRWHRVLPRWWRGAECERGRERRRPAGPARPPASARRPARPLASPFPSRQAAGPSSPPRRLLRQRRRHLLLLACGPAPSAARPPHEPGRRRRERQRQRAGAAGRGAQVGRRCAALRGGREGGGGREAARAAPPSGRAPREGAWPRGSRPCGEKGGSWRPWVNPALPCLSSPAQRGQPGRSGRGASVGPAWCVPLSRVPPIWAGVLGLAAERELSLLAAGRGSQVLSVCAAFF